MACLTGVYTQLGERLAKIVHVAATEGGRADVLEAVAAVEKIKA